jgi:hypothetical protein
MNLHLHRKNKSSVAKDVMTLIFVPSVQFSSRISQTSDKIEKFQIPNLNKKRDTLVGRNLKQKLKNVKFGFFLLIFQHAEKLEKSSVVDCFRSKLKKENFVRIS